MTTKNKTCSIIVVSRDMNLILKAKKDLAHHDMDDFFSAGTEIEAFDLAKKMNPELIIFEKVKKMQNWEIPIQVIKSFCFAKKVYVYSAGDAGNS